MRRTTVLLALAVAAIVASGAALATGPIEFTPRAGFGGKSEGKGTLKLILGKPRPFRVRSRGIEQADGKFRLEQTIFFEGEPSRDRVWVISTVSPNRYSATLSDASGPVNGTTSGPRLSLRYPIKGPLLMQQELELKPDGKTIDNVGTITLFGIRVGHLRETITRSGPGIPSSD